MEKFKKKVYVIGHKNPDTDSICSAIAYAQLKKKLTGREYVAKRAGQINEETQFVLKRFGVAAPAYISDVRTQVKDVDYLKVEGVPATISLKKAWAHMKENNVMTLAVTKEEKLEGVITIGDIATSYMDVYDNTILSRARTQYKNIIDTLDGEMIVGNEHGYYIRGKVVIAAANPDLMEDFIKDNDLVILGNRYESQLCAIEMNAGCIIVCDGARVSTTIRKLAEEKECVVISTPHDTFTAARLINQSIPIKQFMSRENLITFRTDTFIEDIRDIMAKNRHRDFPVIDKKGRYAGIISRQSLLKMDRKRVILVDHNEKSQAVKGIDEAEILEIIDHHRLGSLETMSPVFFRNQPLGCTATILWQMYEESGVKIPKDIAGLLCAAILSDTLMFRSPTCTDIDEKAARMLAEIAGIDVEAFAAEMFNAGSNLKNKTADEIFHQDFKKFSVNGVSFGVGQINSMNAEELENIKERLELYLQKTFGRQENDMLFFMLTNIIEESTQLLCYGANAKSLVEESFEVLSDSNVYTLNGVVSRKKQLIPAFVTTLQQ